jgi:hypothetical protein
VLKNLLFQIRIQLRKIDWLARFYRKYFMKLPLDGGYSEIQIAQNALLSALNVNKLTSTFSIIVPTYLPELILFKEMVYSVLVQSYEHWQLVITE